VPRHLFKTLKKPAGCFQQGNLSLSVYKTANQSRFSVVISKTVSSKAVDRNRLRRIIYHGICKNLPEIKEKSIYIMYARPGLNNEKSADIIMSVEKILKQSQTAKV